MKQTIAFMLILVISITVYGQELQYKEHHKDYSWRTASKSQIDSFYYDLEPVQTSKMKAHVRVSLTGQVIDLFSPDGKNYGGVLTNTITEYSSVKGENVELEVFQKVELDSSKVKCVIDSLISKQIDIPYYSTISNWERHYLHCGSIHFQFNIVGQYKAQEYFCPWSQNDLVPFKTIVVGNYNLVKTTFNLDSLYREFENKLPKGKSYSRDGYHIMNKMTDKQSERWAKDKPIRDYLKSIKGAVDSCIKKELSNQEIKRDGINCFEDYRLIFGVDGKLRKIELSYYNKPKLRDFSELGDYLAEKREISKCKRKIEEIFSVIDLSFLNLEHEVYRTFTFDHTGQFQLRDDTKY